MLVTIIIELEQFMLHQLLASIVIGNNKCSPTERSGIDIIIPSYIQIAITILAAYGETRSDITTTNCLLKEHGHYDSLLISNKHNVNVCLLEMTRCTLVQKSLLAGYYSNYQKSEIGVTNSNRVLHEMKGHIFGHLHFGPPAYQAVW